MLRKIGFFIVYILCGSALGAIVGRIVVQFSGEIIFMQIFSVISMMLVGMIVASKIKQTNGAALFCGLVAGLVIGLILRDTLVAMTYSIAEITNVKVYVNPREITSFGMVYGSVFGFIFGIFAFILISLNFVIEFNKDAVLGDLDIGDLDIGDLDILKGVSKNGESDDTQESTQSQTQAHATGTSSQSAQQNEIKIPPPDPCDVVLNTAVGIALALGAKVASKCNRILDSDMILLFKHVFGNDVRIDNLGKYNSIEDIYDDILNTQARNYANINTLCFNLKKLNTTFDDKNTFIKTLLIIGFGNESADEITFQIAVGIGINVQVYASLKQELDIFIHGDNSFAYQQSQDMVVDEASSRTSEEEIKTMYQILEVSPDCSDEELKKSYHYLIAKYHPDRYFSKELPKDIMKYTEERFKEIKRAYDVIKEYRGVG